MARIRVDAFECDVCGHRWLSHDVPKRCARCKSRAWDRSSADVPQLREQAQAEKQERKANLQKSVADVLKAKEPPARAIPLEAPTRTIICPHLANWVNAANRCTGCGAKWKDGAWAIYPTWAG